MDGVVAHFDALYPDSKEFNRSSKNLSQNKRVQKDLFWKEIEKIPSFWHDIPVMKNIEQLLSTAKRIGEIFILTKTPGARHFVRGQEYVDFIAKEKRQWILKHLPRFFDDKHIIVCQQDKIKVLHPSFEDILIDDRQENIDEWTAQGGQGILFTTVLDTEKKLLEIIKT